MRAENWPEAIGYWREVLAVEPSAANWNDLAYTYLLAEEWQEAFTAADHALKLEAEHPGALYNRGMARIELADLAAAIADLRQSSLLQPERYEPHLGLARAYRAQGSFALASHTIAQASRLAGGAGDVEAERARVAALRSTNAALPTPCSPIHTSDTLTLCLGPGKPVTLYVQQEGGTVHSLALGPSGPLPDKQAVMVDLGDNLTGFFLQGDEAGAYVSGSRWWYLVVLGPEGLEQVLFTGNVEPFIPPVSDALRSSAPPKVQGDEIIALYRIDAGAQIVNEIVRKLDRASLTASYQSTDRYDLKGAPLPPLASQRAAVAVMQALPEVRALATALVYHWGEVISCSGSSCLHRCCSPLRGRSGFRPSCSWSAPCSPSPWPGT